MEKIKDNIPKAKALIKEARETILEIKNTTNQTKSAISNKIRMGGNLKHNPQIAPTLVATPLPPLNRKKQVQLCQPRLIIASGVTNKDLPLVHALFQSDKSFRILNPRPEFINSLCLKETTGIDLLILNHEELALCLGKEISEENISREDLACLHKMGIDFVLITCNRHGVVFSGKSIFSKYPAISFGPAISSTGTGDAFTSAFVAGILEGLNLEKCFLWARVFAGLKVTKAGGSNLPTYEEFINGLSSFD